MTDRATPSQNRQRRQLQIDRRNIRRASIERHGELAAVHIETAEDSHTFDVMTGRGVARAVLDELGR